MKPVTGYFNRPEVKIARILTVVIFLALIRTIVEMFRWQDGQSFLKVRMCVSGALTAAIGLFIMVLLSFWSKHWIIIFLGGITLLSLVMIKEGLR
jgi:hypothetical protein